MIQWSTACPDWERRILAGESLVPEPLFPDQAKEALEYFGALRMVDAAGSPLMADTVRPWVNQLVAAIFGAYDEKSGRRFINEALILISKKNGKSTIAAGVMLTALLLNWRHSGEFIILAPTKEVADNSYKPIRDMIAADEDLKRRFKVQDYFRLVTDNENGATLKVVAADSDTVSGKKAIGVFVDELHEFGKQAKAANMLLEATGGLTSRPEGFVIYATTQSEDPPAGVFKEKLTYARRVRDGDVDDKTFLPVLYEFPQAMVEAKEHMKLENAYVTNPNWGLSVDVPYIEKKYKQAKEEGEEAFRLFLAKHLNVEIGLNLRSDRWTGADFWEAQSDESITFESLLKRCEVITVGIDGGGNDDLYGFHAVGKETGTGDLLTWGRAWSLPIVLERRKEIAPRLLDFQKQGDLVIVPRIEDACEQVVALIERIDKAGLLGELNDGKKKAIGVDASGIKQTLDALNAADYTDDQICAVSQGWRLASSIKSAELYLSSGVMRHAAQPLMAWCVGNARVEPKGNAVLITKQASGTAKIDPLMALFDAVELMAMAPEPTERKYQVMVF